MFAIRCNALLVRENNPIDQSFRYAKSNFLRTNSNEYEILLANCSRRRREIDHIGLFLFRIFYLHKDCRISNLFQQMAIHAHKHGEESNDALQQRFKKQVQKTGLMKLLRERATFKRTRTKRLQRIRALKREDYRSANRKKQFYSNM